LKLARVPTGQGLADLRTSGEQHPELGQELLPALSADALRRRHGSRAAWAPRSRRGRGAPPARAATILSQTWSVAVTMRRSRCCSVASPARCSRQPLRSGHIQLRPVNFVQGNWNNPTRCAVVMLLAPAMWAQVCMRLCSLQAHASPCPSPEKGAVAEATGRATSQQHQENSRLALFKSVAAVAVWYSSNIGLLILNKYMLSGFGFRRPVFLTLW
jgi:hypothetical protein